MQCVSEVKSSGRVFGRYVGSDLMVKVHLGCRTYSRWYGTGISCELFSPLEVGLLDVNKVLEVGRQEEEARPRYVVKIDMAPWAERNYIVVVPDVIERRESLLHELRELKTGKHGIRGCGRNIYRMVSSAEDMAYLGGICAAVPAGLSAIHLQDPLLGRLREF